MAISALHGAFQNLVMEGQIKLVLYFAVAGKTELRFVDVEQFYR